MEKKEQYYSASISIYRGIDYKLWYERKYNLIMVKSNNFYNNERW